MSSIGKELPMTTSYTITCSRPTNYGAVLQTYGLNTALRKMGVDAKVLDYNPKYYYTSTQPLPIRMVRAVVRFPDLTKGRKVFGKFLEDYVPMSAKTYRTLAEIEADVPQSDVYICGSDQIWNCKNKLNGKDDAFFLSFAPAKARKVAYAASIAMPEIPNNQKTRYRRLISDFDAVSVREPSSVPMLEDLGIDNVQSVIDPVFLLERNDWDVIADASDFVPTEDYVLVYGYNRQKAVYAYARRLAKKLGVKVYTIGTAIEDYTLDQDRYFWNAPPNTFVNLVRNAKAVVTNSFHGTVFSIVYNKPFHFFTVKQTTNSRMLDLLDSLTLKDRHVVGEELLSNDIDYDRPNQLLAEAKKRSLGFLQTNVASYVSENKPMKG